MSFEFLLALIFGVGFGAITVIYSRATSGLQRHSEKVQDIQQSMLEQQRLTQEHSKKTLDAIVTLVFRQGKDDEQRRRDNERLDKLVEAMLELAHDIKDLAAPLTVQGDGQQVHFRETRQAMGEIHEKVILIAKRVEPKTTEGQQRRSTDRGSGGVIGLG